MTITQTDTQTNNIFQVALFNRVADSTPKPARWSWGDLLGKIRKPIVRPEKDGPLFSGAIYTKPYRENKNVAALSILQLDYDHDVTIEHDGAVWRKLSLTHAIYSTHSSRRITAENPKAEERFRVVIPLAVPIPADKYPALWQWANLMSGGKLDPSRKDLAGMFYLPSIYSADAPYTYDAHDGALLDWREMELGQPERRKASPKKEPGLKPGADYSAQPDAFERSRALLEGDGWTLFRADELGELWSRPGITDHCSARLFREGHLYVFSSNAAPLVVGETYSPFALLAELKYAGDFSAAAKALAAEGYGDKRPAKSEGGEEKTAPQPDSETDQKETVFDDAQQLADFGNAARFLNAYRATTRYVYERKKYLCHDDKRWSDDQGIVEDRANRIIKGLRFEPATPKYTEEQIFKHYIKSQSPERRSAMLALARAEIRIDFDEFDADPEIFNVWNGTIHLPTGDFRPHDPKDLCTKISKVKFDKDARCPQWLKFLADIFNSDQALIDFIKRAVGYSLSGWIVEQKLFLLYGIGANGKSTFLNVLKRLLGEYAAHTQMATFTSRKDGASGHNESLANLAGARLITAVETEESKRLSEGLIKQITGGDPVTASRKGEHEFTFTPRFKLWLAANHKPIIRGTDDGIWRRPILIPFLQQFESDGAKLTGGKKPGDPKLESKLLTELPGILNWALEGYREWGQGGLQQPEAVRDATESYRQESDILANFIEEELVKLRADQPGNTGGEIYKAYQLWCEENGEKEISNRQFAAGLEERGFTKKKDRTGRVRYFGVALSVRTVAEVVTEGRRVTDSSSGQTLHAENGETQPDLLSRPSVNPPSTSNLKDLQATQNPTEPPNITPEGWEAPF